MITLRLSDSDLKVLVAALDARDRYLAGIAERQLGYRNTPTRNRKLESIEAERLTVEGIKFRILGEMHLAERNNRSITASEPAPKENK